MGSSFSVRCFDKEEDINFKMVKEVREENCSEEFMDAGQYQRNGILRYEKVFGHTFISTGGKQTTEEFVKELNLKPGMRVLDIGCGIGGSAFYMARNFGAEVLGIDLSNNMLDIANERKMEMEENIRNSVSFRYLDATTAVFPANSFDVVYSRDAIMHILDKEPLYERILTWLRPGGQLLVSEYIHGRNYPDLSQEYLDYLEVRGYQLLPVQQYGKMLTRVGYKHVKAIDKTEEFISILKNEMVKFKPTRDKFIKEFSLKDYNELVDGWDIKVVRCTKGEQGWGLFKAVKE